MKIISYSRFSSPAQALGDSARRQVERAKEYAALKGWELDETLVDEGLSAYHGINKVKGALASIKRRTETGEIPRGSILIVESLDRLSRQEVTVALRYFLELVQDSGLEIHTLCDNQVYKNPVDTMQLILSIFTMCRANQESQMKSDRIQAAAENKRKEVMEGTREVAFGRAPAWIEIVAEGKNKKFQLIPERAKIVAQIYEWGIAGRGVRWIAKELNTTGVKPWGNRRKKNGAEPEFWYFSYIDKILHTPSVYGYYRFHNKRGNGKRTETDLEVEEYYPAAVSKETFYLYQSRVKRENKGVRKDAPPSNILSGLNRCPLCGEVLQTSIKNRKKNWVYVTCPKTRAGQCEQKAVRVDALERHFIISLRDILSSLDKDTSADSLDALDAQIDAKKGQLDRLVDTVASEANADLRDVFAGKIRTVKAEVEEMKKEREKLYSEQMARRTTKDIQPEEMLALMETDRQRVREWILRVVSRVEVHSAEQLRIFLK